MTKPRHLVLAIGVTALGFALVFGVRGHIPREALPGDANPTLARAAAAEDRAFAPRTPFSLSGDPLRTGR